MASLAWLLRSCPQWCHNTKSYYHSLCCHIWTTVWIFSFQPDLQKVWRLIAYPHFAHTKTLALCRWFSATTAIYKLIPDNDKGKSDCCRIQKSRWSTYNVDNRERRHWNYYITTTHNVSKKICWRSATLCVMKMPFTQMSSRFWYDRHLVKYGVNWHRIYQKTSPERALLSSELRMRSIPAGWMAFCQKCACVLERQRCA